MRIIAFLPILPVLIFAGCACSSVTKQTVSGDRWVVRSNRLFWQTENVSVKTSDGTTVNVSKTGTEAELLGAIVGAAIKAAK